MHISILEYMCDTFSFFLNSDIIGHLLQITQIDCIQIRQERGRREKKKFLKITLNEDKGD